MKQLISLFALILFAITANAQMQLDDFYKPGATWCQTEDFDVIKSRGVHRVHTCSVLRDTVINNKTYHLISYSAHDLIYMGFPPIRNIEIGGIRVSNDSVFFIKTNSLVARTGKPFDGALFESIYDDRIPMNSEILLLRYDLNMGDKVPFNAYSSYCTVTQIDTITVSNGYRLPRYELTLNPTYGFYKYYWIWGIGSINGFLGLYSTNINYYSNMYNNAYLSYGIGSPGLAYSECFPLDIKQIEEHPYTFNIYPNPLFDNTLHITSTGIRQLNVLNMTGKLVYTTAHIAPGNQDISIDLPTGIYIIKAQLADGTQQVLKLIRQ